MKQRQYIDFLNKIEKLKCNTRHSWTSSGRQESVAEHSWRLAVMAMLCADEYPDLDINKVINSNTYLALMGVENEYGPLMPNLRVLNNNRPFNFLLSEPTLLEYIETTFSLHNMGATELLNNPNSSGMIIPSKELEDTLLEQSLKGIASKEIAHLLKDVETTC